jgi:hypothetical protein
MTTLDLFFILHYYNCSKKNRNKQRYLYTRKEAKMNEKKEKEEWNGKTREKVKC